MKYTILGFQQDKLIENDLDIKDALILRTLLDMYSSPKMDQLIIDNERYIWVNWGYFIEQIPLVVKSRKTLEPKIKRYVDELFLFREIKHSKKNVAGTFVYLRPSEKLVELTDYIAPLENEGCHTLKTRDTIPQKQGNKDSSIIDSITERKNTPTNSFQLIIDNYTNNESLKETIWEFIKMRTNIKKKMTDKALTILLNKLSTLESDDSKKIEILENSIVSSWSSIYALKNSPNKDKFIPIKEDDIYGHLKHLGGN